MASEKRQIPQVSSGIAADHPVKRQQVLRRA
jgi:hypothetical protein